MNIIILYIIILRIGRTYIYSFIEAWMALICHTSAIDRPSFKHEKKNDTSAVLTKSSQFRLMKNIAVRILCKCIVIRYYYLFIR